MERQSYTATELGKLTGTGEKSVRNAVKRGEIPHIRLGRRIILPKAAIDQWLRTAGGSFARPEAAQN